MNPELDKILCDKYPVILQERHKPVSESAMGWGFQCGDGWYHLIDSLCAFIEEEVKHGADPVVFVTVKEKLGALRIYYQGGNEVISGVVHFVERFSTSICEECGSSAKLVTINNFLLKTVCDGCLDKLKDI